ncbi:alpha/beta hydrolase [Halovulum dunhuangense]|uniref:Alpha/beta hydrolase n=1 Tax=Halovulum dunhuangense TaxID=1505036 RepID=A0A849L2Q7_9RHOB|nr:alpha/beta hydrolase [Halovulum dunhuangense]NNU80520.1 alpha/beta hydrolase [Halovulum dunhuangense]
MRYIRPRPSTSEKSDRPDPRRRALVLGASAVGLAGLAGCAASTESDLTQAATRPSGDFITVEGTRLHYQIAGRGPKAVAIHGASGNLRDWTIGPAQALGRQNTLLMFDRPGLGFSERPARDGDDPFVQARLMRQAAAQLGFGEAIVMGHSYGGSVALAWAIDAPDRVPGLVLISAPSQVWPGGVGVMYGLAGNPVTGPLVSRILPALASDSLVRGALDRIFAPQRPPEGYAENVGADLALRPATVRANAADVGNLKGHLRRMVPRYDRLSMPIEVIHGDTDGIVPADIHAIPFARAIPQARLTLLEGVGHMPHHVATPVVAQALSRLNAAI